MLSAEEEPVTALSAKASLFSSSAASQDFSSEGSSPVQSQHLLSRRAATTHIWQHSICQFGYRGLDTAAVIVHQMPLHWGRKAVDCTTSECNQLLLTRYGSSSIHSSTLLYFHL